MLFSTVGIVTPPALMEAQEYPANHYYFGSWVVSALRPVVYAPAVRGVVRYPDPSGRQATNWLTGVSGVAQLSRPETDAEMQARVKLTNASIEKQHADAVAAAAKEAEATRYDLIGRDWMGDLSWGMLRKQYMVDEGARKSVGLPYRGFAAYKADNQSSGSFGIVSALLDPVVHAVSSVSETAVHANTVAVEAEQFRQQQVVESTAINETMKVVIPAALAVMGGYAIYTAAGGGAAVAAASSETAAAGTAAGTVAGVAADAVTVSYTVEGVAGVATTGLASVETVAAGTGIVGTIGGYIATAEQGLAVVGGVAGLASPPSTPSKPVTPIATNRAPVTGAGIGAMAMLVLFGVVALKSIIL